MEEFRTLHLLIEHPIVLFFVFAILIFGLALVVAYKLHKRETDAKGQTEERRTNGSNR